MPIKISIKIRAKNSEMAKQRTSLDYGAGLRKLNLIARLC